MLTVPGSRVSTESKVAALRLPGTYPGRAASVEVIETHMSWVFLTPDQVFKLKKPVRYDGVDFATLEARHFYCLEELRLNRRLAPAVYLDVVPLRVDAAGALRLGDRGEVVDWLVWMRRLPADLMLDRLLEEGRATVGHMRRIAELLSAFYRGLAPAASDGGRYIARLGAAIDGCERELCDPSYELRAADVRRVCAQLQAFLQSQAALFEARVRAGRIVEGHGDLRPEHIWLGVPTAIIDCLEFSVDLRTADVADELGFLALECERLGAPQLGRALLDAHAGAAGDVPEPALVDFYQAWRACSRATIAIRHLKEERYRDSPQWAARARRYLELAAAHIEACGPARS